MPDDMLYIPFPRKLYDDIIRFSDGKMDPAALAEQEVRSFIESTIDSSGSHFWGDRIEDVAAKYAPETLAHWRKQAEAGSRQQTAEWEANNKPLVWKEVTVESGSEVRMSYGGTHHYATVRCGCIVDNDRIYSPSEWASKVAGGTSRNAWRDLWFREPLSKTWVPAQLLRDQAKEGMKASPALISEDILV